MNGEAKVTSDVVDVEIVAEPAPPARAFADAAAVDESQGRVGRFLTAVGERLNPILVKETRQALKSRQFVLTFAALLVCGWGWSILGVALVGPGWQNSSAGREMFYGYYLVLAFPLLVVVPFSAYRSLVAERDDRTHELLSITALHPWQIVTGKLGSAVVQMLVYLSALAPCLAFTYLLRGIDIISIGAVLLGTVTASLVFSCWALMLATSATERHWQVLLSVAIIAGLLTGFWVATAIVYYVLGWGAQFLGDPEFWFVFASLWLVGVTYAVVALLAAAAELTFAADNRATRLRIGLFVQQMVLAAWALWVWLFMARGDLEFLAIPLLLAFMHWWFCGAIMSGESAELSPRVKRELPTSFFGRVFLTWFNPGPGTGYVFAVVNMTALVGLACLFIGWDPFTRYYQSTGHSLTVSWMARSEESARQAWPTNQLDGLYALAILLPSYLLIYLGMGRLLIAWLRRFFALHVVAVLVIQALLVAAGVVIPLTIHMSLPAVRGDYHWIEAFNVFYTTLELGEGRNPSPYAPVVLIIVPLAAATVFLLNLRSLAREVAHTRIAKPRRVVEDETAQEVQPAAAR